MSQNISPAELHKYRQYPWLKDLNLTRALSSFHNLEWMPTNIHLPSTSSMSNLNYEESNEELFLCLPTFSKLSSAEQRENETLLSAVLDDYLISLPSLKSSTHKLLFGDSSRNDNLLDSKITNNNGIEKSDECCVRDQDQTFPQQRSPCPKLITSNNSGKIINVLQGEIAHCTPNQADILVSDDATTCHILAIWSCYRDMCLDQLSLRQNSSNEERNTVTIHDNANCIVASMAHIDSPGYESSLRCAIMEHCNHHSKNHFKYDNGTGIYSSTGAHREQLDSYMDSDDCHLIDFRFHILGGYRDDDGASMKITYDILRSLSTLSTEFNDYFSCIDNNASTLTLANTCGKNTRCGVRMTLETCVASSANDDGAQHPLGRGLAIEVASGKVFLAEVDQSCEISPSLVKERLAMKANSSSHGVELVASDRDLHCLSCNTESHISFSAAGPEVLLRSIRHWAAAFHKSDPCQCQELCSITHTDNACIFIQPFFFCPHLHAKILLQLNDAELIHVTSTSPKVEKPNFVIKVREALTFMNANDSSSFFVKVDGVDQAAKYSRVGLNGWVRTQ